MEKINIIAKNEEKKLLL